MRLFAVRVEPVGAGAVVWVSGEVDMSVADVLQHVLVDTAGRPRTRRMVVDFEQVSFLDPSGLGAVVAGYAAAAAAGVTFTVRNATGVVARVLAVMETTDNLESGHPDGGFQRTA
jgi:anti-sigma B factor antagonist